MTNNAYREQNGVPPLVLQLIDRLRSNYKNAFRLRWRGTKIPRGASIDGDPIAWTQHGIVYGASNGTLGHYTRLEESTGPNHDEHEMLIATDGILQRPPDHFISVQARRHPRKKRRIQKKWLRRYGTRPLPDPANRTDMSVELIRSGFALDMN